MAVGSECADDDQHTAERHGTPDMFAQYLSDNPHPNPESKPHGRESCSCKRDLEAFLKLLRESGIPLEESVNSGETAAKAIVAWKEAIDSNLEIQVRHVTEEMTKEMEAQEQVLREEAANLVAQHTADHSPEIVERITENVRKEVEAEFSETLQQEVTYLQSQLDLKMKEEIETRCAETTAEIQTRLENEFESRVRESEKKIREEMRGQAERKMREALLSKLKPVVRSELEGVVMEEIKAEVNADLTPVLEKKIQEKLERNMRAQIVKDEEVRLRRQLEQEYEDRKKELEVSLAAKSKSDVEQRVSKEVKQKVRVETEKIRKEFAEKQCAESLAAVAEKEAKLKESMAEFSRMRTAENLKKTRDENNLKKLQRELKEKEEKLRKNTEREERKISRERASLEKEEKEMRKRIREETNALLRLQQEIEAADEQRRERKLEDRSAKRAIKSLPVAAAAQSSAVKQPSPNSRENHHNFLSADNFSAFAVSPSRFDPKTVASRVISEVKEKFSSVRVPKSESVGGVSPFSLRGESAEQVRRADLHPEDLAELDLIDDEIEREVKDHVLAMKPPVAPLPKSRTPTRVEEFPPAVGQELKAGLEEAANEDQVRCMEWDTICGALEQERCAKVEYESTSQPNFPSGGKGNRMSTQFNSIVKLWDALEISYISRLGLVVTCADGDIPEAEVDQLLASELDRLAKLRSMCEREMRIVSHREDVKDRIAQLERVGTKKSSTELSSLQNELRRLTFQLGVSLGAWTQTYKQPFMYRGIDYNKLLEAERQLSDKKRLQSNLSRWSSRGSRGQT